MGQHAKESVDAVVSFGIGGSYLGGKVLFDVHCGEFWNQKSEAERDGIQNYTSVAIMWILIALMI